MPLNKSSPLTSAVIGHFIIDLYSPILPVILPLLITSMDLSYFLAGLVVTVFNVVSSIFQPLVGIWSDKTGKHASIALCILLGAVGISFAAVAGNYLILVCLVAGAALGHAFFHTSGMDLVYKNSPPAKIGLYNSIFTTAGSLSYALSPLLVGALIAFAGLPSVAWLSVIGFVAAGWIWMRTKKSGAPGTSLPKKTARPSQIEGNKTAAALVVIVCALRAVGYIGIITYLPTLLLQTQEGMTTLLASVVVTVMLISGVAGQLTGGWAGDKIGRKLMLVIGLSASIPSYLLIFAGNTVLMYLGLMVYAFFASCCYVTSVTMTQELLPGKTGLASGLTLGFTLGLGGLAASGVGLIADATGDLSGAMFLLIIPIILAPVIALFIRYKKPATAAA
ncbi:MAG TPA: MFS transporter [Methanocorpusculum sp.]|nr:MFS transporter [Methanocorpusculum sp.]